MVHLQKLHEKHAKDGLVVLGFNNADKKALAVEHLKKHNVTYPTVLDNSDKAVRLVFDKYKTSAVPTTYVIDREGKVAAAWIGGQEDNEKWAEVLQ